MNRLWARGVALLREPTLRAALNGGAWALAGTFVGRVINVGALLVAARVLGSADFGGVSLALSTALVVSAVSGLGLPVATQKLVAEARSVDAPRAERLTDAALAVAATVGIAAVVLLATTAPWVATHVLDQDGMVVLLAIASALVLLTPTVELLAGLLSAHERFADVGRFRAVQGLLAGGVLGGALLLAPGPANALWALVAAEATTCLLGLWLVRRGRPAELRRVWFTGTRPAVRDLLKVSLPAMVAGVALQPALWLGQVVLGRQPGGLELVGLFAVALRWHAIALFVPATMGSVLLPMLGRLRATDRVADARDLFVRYGAMTLAFSVLAALVLIVLSGPLMALQGPGFAGGAAVLAALALAVVPTALNNVLSQRALAEGRVALWVWSDAALAGTLAVSALVLVPLFQGVGLAVAYLLAYIATCAVLLPVARAARRTVAGR
ncbi:oligosaccharide flippase family protein [Pseudonocardia sp. TRM90224]|uniref:oligosaccharide flippase family protein n=1 Tax=Pseudonocardia sp. TRM90224 TaxID=2812678 RepID=UPI001E3BECE2|nr:oligosaccharide flippase family protein [Pseudonocardia sp. TRM90224]